MQHVSAHRACVTSTGGGLLLEGGGLRSLMKRVSDTTCLLNRGLPLPRPSPCSTCALKHQCSERSRSLHKRSQIPNAGQV